MPSTIAPNESHARRRWLAKVDGDIVPGANFAARTFSCGWEIAEFREESSGSEAATRFRPREEWSLCPEFSDANLPLQLPSRQTAWSTLSSAAMHHRSGDRTESP